MNTQTAPRIDGIPARAMFEQPFTERTRTFLRLEQLFDRAHHAASRKGRWDSYHGAGTVLEILALLNRGDLRSEILKEADRIGQSLRRMADHAAVDTLALEAALKRVEEIRRHLLAGSSPDRALRENDFLTMIGQRLSIPGGTCGFDLPRLQAWMELPASDRLQHVEDWLAQLEPLKQGVCEILALYRESAEPARECASRGFFQHSFQPGAPVCQMLQVFVPEGTGIYPEISGNRQRFTIRFMHLGDLSGQARPVREDVDFGLALCQL